MKKLQNTLYILKEGAYLHKENETLIIDFKENDKTETLLKVPMHAVGNIFCFGNIMVSPQLLGFCGDNGVQLSFYTQYGRFQARVIGQQSGNILLRQAQFEYAKSQDLRIAKNIIAAKVRSSRNLIQRYVRTYGKNEDLDFAAGRMQQIIKQLEITNDKDLIRGLEGEAARYYFQVFDQMIRVKEKFSFSSRNRRPPKDPINSLLSFLYSIYSKEISGALQGVGLDPQMGFFHTPRPGRDSLALDLLEEFRSPIVDRLVLSIVNRGQLEPDDFVCDVLNGVTLKHEARKKLLQIWQTKKQEEIMHPFLKEFVPIGLLPHVQAMLMARFLRKDLDNYPPFISRQ